MIYRYHLSRTQLRKGPAPRRDSSAQGRRPAPAHRKAGSGGRRDASRLFRASLVSLASAGLLTLGIGGADLLLHTERFALKEIRVSGLERLAEPKILNGIRPPSGTRLFDLKLGPIQEALLAEPWIREVGLRKDYPDTLSVFIVERRPAAVLSDPPLSALADETGAIIAQWTPGEAAGAWSSLPAVRGVSISDMARGDAGALERYAVALTALREAAPLEGEGLIVDVARPSDVQVLRDGRRFYVGTPPFEAKWKRFRSVQAEIATHPPPAGGEVVDLRFPDQVIIR